MPTKDTASAAVDSSKRPLENGSRANTQSGQLPHFLVVGTGDNRRVAGLQRSESLDGAAGPVNQAAKGDLWSVSNRPTPLIGGNRHVPLVVSKCQTRPAIWHIR